MNYVTCQGCSGWLPEQRIYKLCNRCNNSGLVQDPKEVLCNMCGGEMCVNNEQTPHGLARARVMGGFNSYHLFDLTSYTFNLCEKCLRKLFNEFKIPPIVSDMDIWGDEEETSEWKHDQKSYEFRVWKDSGGHHQAYLDGKCNEEKDCPNTAAYTILHSGKIYSTDCCCEIHKEKYNAVIGAPQFYELVPFIPDVLKAFV